MTAKRRGFLVCVTLAASCLVASGGAVRIVSVSCLGEAACGAVLAGTVVDFGAICGKVKPVNGVGQPPMIGMPAEAPLFHYLGEAGIPYSRIHDVGGVYGQCRYVDIPNIFKDFSADENDPKNYSFEFTDILMKRLAEQGVEPIYRLGVTIENTWEQVPADGPVPVNAVRLYRIGVAK